MLATWEIIVKEFELSESVCVFNTFDWNVILDGVTASNGDITAQISQNEVLECQLPKGSFVTILKELGDFYEITSKHYPFNAPLYIEKSTSLQPQTLSRSSLKVGLSNFLDYQKKIHELQLPYLWGGNIIDPISLYERKYLVHGMDCTGRIFQNSMFRCNTAQAVFLGKTIPIANKTQQEIIDSLCPGMIIVWANCFDESNRKLLDGHLMIAIQDGHIVESSNKRGNAIYKNEECFDSILSSMEGVDSWKDTDYGLRYVVRDPFFLHRNQKSSRS